MSTCPAMPRSGQVDMFLDSFGSTKIATDIVRMIPMSNRSISAEP
jgi:hypothetical protein